MNEEWIDILKDWSANGDTKLHFFAEKVLYNANANNSYLLDEPIFVLYKSPEEEDVGFIFLSLVVALSHSLIHSFTHSLLKLIDNLNYPPQRNLMS